MSKFKTGDKVKTRDGLDVEIVYINDKLEQPVVGVLHYEDGEVGLEEWSEDGSYVEGRTSDADILPLSRTVTMYPALVRHDGVYYNTGTMFTTEDEAKKYYSPDNFIRLLTEYPVEVEL